jgi:hypothetical protein
VLRYSAFRQICACFVLNYFLDFCNPDVILVVVFGETYLYPFRHALSDILHGLEILLKCPKG